MLLNARTSGPVPPDANWCDPLRAGAGQRDDDMTGWGAIVLSNRDANAARKVSAIFA